MRYTNVRNSILGAFALACLCGWLVFGAAPCVDASTVPSETVDVSDTSNLEETEAVEDFVDSAGDSAGDDAVLYADVSDDFSNLAYLDISSSLGNIRLYLPYGVEAASLQVIDGQIINTNSSTVYLYCPSYPDYTFSASRFSPVSYRTSGYDTVELTNVEVAYCAFQLSDYFPQIMLLAAILTVFYIVGGGFKS